MRRVGKDEFYAAIGPLDVEVSVRGKYEDDDYGIDFHLTGRRVLVGQTRAVGLHPSYKPDHEYFLADTAGRTP